jgi:hypothetical protein
LVVTTDPEGLPELSSWYLVTDLPRPGSDRAREEGALPAADLSEVVRLYGLRMWVEQSYKQVKQALGWSQYQVRSDLAIRRHWQLVWCAFSFCRWSSSSSSSSSSDFLEAGASPTGVVATKKDEADTIIKTVERGKKGGRGEAAAVLAASVEEGEGVARTLHNGVALLESVLGSSPAKGVRRVA